MIENNRNVYYVTCNLLNSVRCFKQIWKVGKVGEVGKVGREGLIMPAHGINCDCPSTVEFLLSPGKIFCLCKHLIWLEEN